MRRHRAAVAIASALLVLPLADATARSARSVPASRGAVDVAAAPSTRSDIYLIDLATGRVTRITRPVDGASFDGPTWSADGRRLAFSGSICDDCPLSDARLYVTNIGSGRIKRIRLRVAPAARPSWDPRGRWLAFVGGATEWIYRAAPDGSSLTRLVGGSAHDDVVWSPAGRRIAYTTQQPNGHWDLYVADDTGGRAQALTRTAISEEQPAWSPDGSQIAFSRQSSTGAWSLYAMNLDSRHPRRIGPTWRASSEDPAWSPDGATLAFVAVTSSSAALYLMNADGEQVRRLQTGLHRSYDPAWSPDGRMLAFVGGP